MNDYIQNRSNKYYLYVSSLCLYFIVLFMFRFKKPRRSEAVEENILDGPLFITVVKLTDYLVFIQDIFKFNIQPPRDLHCHFSF